MTKRWITHEETPRWLNVEGRSAVDSDVLVAYLADDRRKENAFWIVEHSGHVCGLNVKASPIPAA